MFETALAAGELITSVKFPLPLAAGYAKAPNMASRFALVGVFVANVWGGRTRGGNRRSAIRLPSAGS